MREEARYQLRKLKSRYVLLKSVEVAFISFGAGLLAWRVASAFSDGEILKMSASVLTSLIVGIAVALKYKLGVLTYDYLTRYVNQHYPQMNESADLLLISDEELSPLQQLQKRKAADAFNLIFPSIKPPQKILQSAGVLMACSILFVALSSLKISIEDLSNGQKKEIRPDKNPSSIFIKSLMIIVSPPAYTNIKSFEAKDYNLSFPEGSNIKWQATFSGRPIEAKLFFSGKDSAILNADEYVHQRKFTEPGFYQIQWKDSSKIYRSDFYRLESVKDLPPKISIKELNQFTKLKFTDNLNVQLKSELSDDYGLSDAQIVATVSKGSGEGIKFREEKLRFAAPQKIQGKLISATRVLDLKRLGLEPGDEIYFYVEAWDNKMPLPNRNRTETFFIALQDTSTVSVTEDSGLGVDLMPEYFRSQRQIIIDTEKLLKDRKSLTKQQFNSTSNELGYDQKVLRLRYGQFLGEEDEGGIGVPESHHEDDKEEQDVTKQYGHQHDTKNEHNLVETKKHDHGEEIKGDDKKEDPLKEFVHSHDNTEEATFFYQSLKTKLKAAITQMWDAELYLRLYQPEKSLPYQYKALNLLKEISNDSRIFVHRSGFDPPPLKEEKRLTADLSEVNTNSALRKNETKEKYPSIGKAIGVIEKMIQDKRLINSTVDQKIFEKAGQELSVLAIEQPVIFLKGLSIIKSLIGQEKVSLEQLHQLRKILWRAIPAEETSPTKHSTASHSLNDQFLKSLESQKHE